MFSTTGIGTLWPLFLYIEWYFIYQMWVVIFLLEENCLYSLTGYITSECLPLQGLAIIRVPMRLFLRLSH